MSIRNKDVPNSDPQDGASPSGGRGKNASRRRGKELEACLLDAAWKVLMASGFGGFSFEAVAARAKTSRPVIYRRWSNKEELVIDAVRHWRDRNPLNIPDTSSLRNDLIEYLNEASVKRLEITILFSIHLAEFFRSSDTNQAEFKRKLFLPRGGGVDEIFNRAIARGELRPEMPTPLLRNLPMNLLHHEMIMSLKPVSRETITRIVDEIVLPLLIPDAR